MSTKQATTTIDVVDTALAKAKKAGPNQVAVERAGTKMTLPEGMSLDDAILALTRKKQEEQTPVSIHEMVEAFPLDGAYALMQVLADMFGWAQAVPTEGFFGPNPPSMVTLETDHGEFTQVIWGGFTVPGVKGALETGASRNAEGRHVFTIKGTVTKESQPLVQEIARRVRGHVANFSIYRGKALRITTNDRGEMSASRAPGFLDLTRVNEQELTFSGEVAQQVQTSLWTPIERTNMCRAHKIPLKRGVLLEGPYGTGKTLTATVTAKKCVANGWTFMYLDRVAALREAMRFAKCYGPTVIFAEDIDRVLDGERDVSVDDILNQIDGIEAKNQELIVILTTNHVERIEKAMLRPGRLDAVITVSAPDAAAAQKLVRIYARDLIDDGEDLSSVGTELAGQIPAVIREVVERAKLFAIGRIKDGAPLTLTASDLVAAARGMKHHLALMAPRADVAPTPEQAAGTALATLYKQSLNGGLSTIQEKVDALYANM